MQEGKTLPPRKQNTPSKPSNKKQNEPNELQILQTLQIPKFRAEKALASTGYRGVQLAFDWLLAHVNDPYLDVDNPREYILYVCPTGPLHDELEKFWIKSREICGWNGAHNFMPHITLVSFFKAPDENAQKLSETLKQVAELVGKLDQPLQLECYISQNFMGFFVVEDDANYLKRIALQFVKEVSHSIIGDTYDNLDALVTCFPWCAVTSAKCIPKSSRSISLEPHVKSLHLTLAYQFPTTQFNTLKSCVETLDFSTLNNSGWELRLYSRDTRLSTRQVYKVLYPHTPRDPDELELRIGDYVYLIPDALLSSCDGWVEGISWLTGMQGFLPKNYIERVAESDAWTLHAAVPINDTIDLDNKSSEVEVDEVDCADLSGNNGVSEQDDNVSSSIKSPKEVAAENLDNLFANPNGYINWFNKRDSILSMNSSSSRATYQSGSLNGAVKNGTSNRKIYIMRHGERMDFTFGSWIEHSFDKDGKYIQKDLNMPESLIERPNGIKSWNKDSPLTNVGVYQAQLVGQALKRANVSIKSVYCSPSYRCVQTCNAILEGLHIKDGIPINIEPGLFEFLRWYEDELPDFLSTDQLRQNGFNINTTYKPYVPIAAFKSLINESLTEFYQRNSLVVENALQAAANSNDDGNLLIVGHATTLDTCSRLVMRKPMRTTSDISRVMHKVPYCSLIALEEVEQDKWVLIEPPILPLMHTNNGRFDWTVFND